MLFDTKLNDTIVIVPPKPDAHLSYHDEFSYSNLYSYEGSYGGDCGASTATATTAASATSMSMGSDADVVMEGACSTATSSSSITSATMTNERSSTISFDSSVFDAAARNSRSNNNSFNNNNNSHNDNNASMNIDNTAANTAANSSSGPSTAITRDPRNGAFTFQVHAEYDLLLHVQKDLDKHRRSCGANSLADVKCAAIIMRSVDEYCLKKQWMYHIGSQKGVAIGRFLREGVESYLKSGRSRSQAGGVKKFTCVELGTYCGYSALVLASTLCQFIKDQSSSSSLSSEPFEFHIYTTEVSTKLLNVAQSVFRLAKMETYITPILIKDNGQESLSKKLQEHNVSNIDFLLLDHAKNLYLDDLQDLEGAELLKAGSYVSADNVVFNRLDAYREHIHGLELKGVVESHLEEMNLEYSNNLKDGMEMTVYLKDPPVNKN